MKSLANLCTALLADASNICSTETSRDLETIRSRARHEGISFFTITLPNFATDFERSLELGYVDSTLFSGWKKRGRLPAFLQGFTSLVFATDGSMLCEPSSSAVYCIRQICRAFKKVKLPCTVRRESKAYEKYLQTEAVLPSTYDLSDERHIHFNECADIIWPHVFGIEFNTLDLVPKHGPGATAEKVSGNAKYSHLSWHERLNEHFPVDEYIFTSVNHLLDHKQGLKKAKMLVPSAELPVRVISVPKDLKTPRIIAIEPVCMQYTQQAVGRWIMKMIERNGLIAGSIRFRDQSVNQRKAICGSADGSLATLDLSEASDRVPSSYVHRMLESVPNLRDAVFACRSRTARIPSGQLVDLKKFASMGSALCFPIESMYFFNIIVHAILWRQRQAPTAVAIRKIAQHIHIYGDDIIVPVNEVESVIEGLEHFKCKVNSNKSFWNGKFRESCGKDAFSGVDVTPIYIREMQPRNRRASSGIVSWISTSNQLHSAGMWKTADFMRHEIDQLMGRLPIVTDTSPGLGWTSFLGLPSSLRTCTSLHRPIVFTHSVKAVKEKDIIDGYPALLKYFLNAGGSEAPLDRLFPVKQSSKHLTQSARCGAVSRKRHWVPAT